MLDALPYLIDYPYGCTEQTMSRFLPAVVVAKTLRDLGLSQEMLESRMFGGIEAQFAAKTHREGKKDLRKLEEMVQAGLKRLYDFQHADGGWGWWKEGESDHWMSGYVIWGLSLASQAGISVRSDVLTRGVDYLAKELVEEEDHFENQAWMLHALAYRKAAGKFETKAFDNLWMNRDRLNAYGRALLALSAHHFGDSERAQVLIRNLENGAKMDDGVAHWGEDRSWWHWTDGAVESTAFALQALLAIDPQHKLVEPVTSWLIKNRRGAQWNNTRDTAIAILVLNDYLRKSGELRSPVAFELMVNGHRIVTKKLASQDILSAPTRYTIDRKFIQNGDNQINVRRIEGSSPLYFSIETSFFSLEEPISSAGNEIFTRREYYKLVGKPTLLKG
ncbi:MAG TPA: alpha-2-macroglobulin, partial [Acidobacteriota bacterium]|nr:alpha-2-macroglobulin [Acidobacteriota bacterium]